MRLALSNRSHCCEKMTPSKIDTVLFQKKKMVPQVHLKNLKQPVLFHQIPIEFNEFSGKTGKHQAFC
jgi:hypothetical protein